MNDTQQTGPERPGWHVINRYGTTDCPVKMVRADADVIFPGGPLECSACGAEVSR